MSVGFEAYNDFYQETTNIVQLYDLTLSLYKKEHERIQNEFDELDPMDSMRTRVGEIEHNLTKNVDFLESYYPGKLRELLLIYLITVLEGYMVDLVDEIFSRDMSPFKRQGTLNLHKGQVLSFTSIDEIRDLVISKEKRRIGSNSISDNSDFFESRFGVSFEDTSANINELKEIHERRNLHVHNNGVCDSKYSRSFSTDFEPGEKVPVDHEYFTYAVDTIEDFAKDLAEKLLNIFPNSERKKSVYKGIDEDVYEQDKILMVIVDAEKGISFEEDISEMNIYGKDVQKKIKELTYQFVNKEGRCVLILGGGNREVGRAVKSIKVSDHLTFRIATDLHLGEPD